jgi:hypothetical protein
VLIASSRPAPPYLQYTQTQGSENQHAVNKRGGIR